MISSSIQLIHNTFSRNDIEGVLHLISSNSHLEEQWEKFKDKNLYAKKLEWKTVMC